MNLRPSDDLAIGPFVRAFPGSAQTTGCQSCSTWETRAQWAETAQADSEMVAFLRDKRAPPRGSRARGPGPDYGDGSGDSGGWSANIPDDVGQTHDGGGHNLGDFPPGDVKWTDAGPPHQLLDFDLPPPTNGLVPCTPIQLPPFTWLPYTRDCFIAEYGVAAWPVLSQGYCQAPCLNVNLRCPYPTAAQMDAAKKKYSRPFPVANITRLTGR